jgi:hypothetical protein
VAGIRLFISENSVHCRLWVSAIKASAYECSWVRYSERSGSLVLDIQWKGSCHVVPWADTLNGTFFGTGGACGGGEKGWPLQREEKREEDALGMKRKERDKAYPLIERLGLSREARAIELGGWRMEWELQSSEWRVYVFHLFFYVFFSNFLLMLFFKNYILLFYL